MASFGKILEIRKFDSIHIRFENWKSEDKSNKLLIAKFFYQTLISQGFVKIWLILTDLDPSTFGQDQSRFGQDQSRFGQDRSRFGQDRSRFRQDRSRFGHDWSWFGQDGLSPSLKCIWNSPCTKLPTSIKFNEGKIECRLYQLSALISIFKYSVC